MQAFEDAGLRPPRGAAPDARAVHRAHGLQRAGAHLAAALTSRVRWGACSRHRRRSAASRSRTSRSRKHFFGEVLGLQVDDGEMGMLVLRTDRRPPDPALPEARPRARHATRCSTSRSTTSRATVAALTERGVAVRALRGHPGADRRRRRLPRWRPAHRVVHRPVGQRDVGDRGPRPRRLRLSPRSFQARTAGTPCSWSSTHRAPASQQQVRAEPGVLAQVGGGEDAQQVAVGDQGHVATPQRLGHPLEHPRGPGGDLLDRLTRVCRPAPRRRRTRSSAGSPRLSRISLVVRPS